jgi:hypothetical protein
MVEVITMQDKNGVFVGLNVNDSVNTSDVVAEASLTLGIERKVSGLRDEMHKIVGCRTSNSFLQKSYVSQSSIALVLYLHSEAESIPVIKDTHIVQKTLALLDEKIQKCVHCARKKKNGSDVFNEPSMWTGVEPMEEEPTPPLEKQDDIAQHSAAALETTCYIFMSHTAMFGEQDAFKALLDEFEQNGV